MAPFLAAVRLPLGLALLSSLSLGVAAPSSAAGRCDGTLLALQVEQRGITRFDRFRFELALEAEGSSKTEAMGLLEQRLLRLRQVLQPLVRGDLTIPAPGTYSSGGGTGPGATPVREHASTTVSGLVNKASYDALIQSAGRLPGVSLRGFSAQPASGTEAALQTALLRQALAEGRRQAEEAASALGLTRVRLLRIDQRGGGGLPRPMPYAVAADRSFDPNEAAPPERSLSLALDYCLS